MWRYRGARSSAIPVRKAWGRSTGRGFSPVSRRRADLQPRRIRPEATADPVGMIAEGSGINLANARGWSSSALAQTSPVSMDQTREGEQMMTIEMRRG